MKHVSAKRMREIDALAQTKYSIPSIILMENAGRSAAEEILKQIKENKSQKIAVFCGKGNNGGDGFVLARHLYCAGHKVDIYLLGKINDVKKPDPLANMKIVEKLGIRIAEIIDLKSVKRLRRKFSYDIVVDAMFGTGFSGKFPVHISLLIGFLNKTKLPIYSIDVPSGLDATTGKVEDIAVKATLTITFGLPKTGFIKSNGPRYIGKVITRNITYPLVLLR